MTFSDSERELMPTWPPDPEVPAAQIVAMKGRVIALAQRLFSEGKSAEDHRIMALAEAMYAWAITLERMATTSPAYHGALGQSFSDHPRFSEPVDDRLIPHRATADLLSFLAIGDLVLNHVGRLWMRQLGRPIPPADDGYQAFLRACDREDIDPLCARAARRLQLSLRSARNRFLAHARPDHARVGGWAIDETPEIHLVALVDEGEQRAAVERLNRSLSEPLPETFLLRPRDYMEFVVSKASDLTSSELWEVDYATRTLGYTPQPVASVIDDVLLLSGAIEAIPREDVPDRDEHPSRDIE